VINVHAWNVLNNEAKHDNSTKQVNNHFLWFIVEGKSGRERPRQKLMDWMMEEYRKLKKGTTTGEVELMAIWTCRKADNLKKTVYCTFPINFMKNNL